MTRLLAPSAQAQPAGFDRRSAARRGMTLLEVLLALGIFLTAMTAIGQLIRTGSQASVEAQLEADAALRAESILQEILGGVQVMQNAQGVPFDDDPNWNWSLSVTDGPHIDLLRLDVTVVRQVGDGAPQMTVMISRLARNPELFLESAATTGTF